MRYLCIHCHCYQPPRENPWLETIELQDSAYPYHDWNERITAECYATNTAARILDEQQRIARIVNNYQSISFNFGPSLLSWMEDKAPETYALVLEADKASTSRFGGHGSAMAQCYNHMIMPLANSRDKFTQIRWGIDDFRHRYGGAPEGMWLPETAVDMETLVAAGHDGDSLHGAGAVAGAVHPAHRQRGVGGRFRIAHRPHPRLPVQHAFGQTDCAVFL